MPRLSTSSDTLEKVTNDNIDSNGHFTIPDGVTTIGERAFMSCTSLSSVTIPHGVTKIGRWAFSDCTGLSSVTIPNSVTEIGGRAFSYCTSLSSVTIPNSVTEIHFGAFNGCRSLSFVTIPGSVTKIGSAVFSYCTSLSSVTILDGVTTIADRAFEGCTRLSSVTIPDSVTWIDERAFMSCTSLSSVIINTAAFERTKTLLPSDLRDKVCMSASMAANVTIAWLDDFWTCKKTTDSTIGWSFFGFRLSPENARILEIKQTIIALVRDNHSLKNIEDIIETLAPIIDYQRDGSITDNTTSTRKTINTILHPESSQKNCCAVGSRV